MKRMTEQKFKRIGMMILKKKINENKKKVFDKILNYAQNRKRTRTNVVYGKIKCLRKSTTPNKNSKSYKLLQNDMDRGKRKVIRIFQSRYL